MATPFAVVLRTHGEAPAWERALPDAALVRVDPALTVPLLSEQVRTAACAIVDGGNRGALDVLRRVQRADPAVQKVIVTEAGRRAAIERALLFTPGLGEVWVVAPGEVGALIARAEEVTGRRRRFGRMQSRVSHDLAVLEPQRRRRVVVSDAYLAALLDAAPDPIFSVDDGGRVLSWNPGAERVLGYSRAEAIGRPVAEVLVSPAGSEPLDLGGQSRRSFWFQRKNQEIGFGDLIAVPVEAAGHRIHAVVLHDLTEERRAQEEIEQQAAELQMQAAELEEQSAELELQVEAVQVVNAELKEAQQELRSLNDSLQESEALFRTLADSIPQLAWIAHADGHIFWYNRRWYTYTGTTPEEMEGWGWQSVHDPEVLPVVLEKWTASIRSGEPFDMEFPLRRHNGEFRMFLTRIAPVRNEAGDVVRWFGTNTDVEALREIERDLASARLLAEARALDAERARARVEVLAEAGAALAASLDTGQALESLCDVVVPRLAEWAAVYLADDAGTITRHSFAGSNPAAVAAYRELSDRFPADYAAEESPVGTVIRSGMRLLVPEVSEEMLAGSSESEEHRRLLRALRIRALLLVPVISGERTIGAISLARSRGGEGFSEDDVALAEELARRAGIALDRARLYEEALSASRAKSGFLATMSHELRTPLNALIGYSDLLLMGIPEPVGPGATQQIRRMDLAARHLLSIIDEILIFSRIEAGREQVNAEPVNLPELIDEVAAIVEPLAHEKRLRFVPPGPPPKTLRLVTDPRKLRQILINLLGNAVKFTDAGVIRFAIEADEEILRFVVTDTGMGIPPEHLSRIFEPFWQVSSGATRTAGGTGLGLSVSRELARLLGGDLAASSVPGEGSTFVLSIPADFPAAADG